MGPLTSLRGSPSHTEQAAWAPQGRFSRCRSIIGVADVIQRLRHALQSRIQRADVCEPLRKLLQLSQH